MSSLGALGWSPWSPPPKADPLADEAKFVAYYGIRPLNAVLVPGLFHCRPCKGTGGDEFKGRCGACKGVGLVKAS